MGTLLSLLGMGVGVLFVIAGVLVVATSADRGGLPYGVIQTIAGGIILYWSVSRRRAHRYEEDGE
jgi:hypothetical protein